MISVVIWRKKILLLNAEKRCSVSIDYHKSLQSTSRYNFRSAIFVSSEPASHDDIAVFFTHVECLKNKNLLFILRHSDNSVNVFLCAPNNSVHFHLRRRGSFRSAEVTGVDCSNRKKKNRLTDYRKLIMSIAECR